MFSYSCASVYELNLIVVSKVKLNFFVEKPGSDVTKSDRIFVYFSDEKNVSIKTMRKCVLLSPVSPRGADFVSRFLETLDQSKVSNGIIVFSDKMTPSARKVRSSYAYTPSLSQAHLSLDHICYVIRIYLGGV